jgi:LacI family transcriptional regulator
MNLFVRSFEEIASMPTVRQVAEQAGVSISTVSLALNDKPGVSEEMRARVQKAFKQLESEESTDQSNKSSDQKRRNQTSLSVVILHPGILRSSQVFSEFLQGIEAGAISHNIQLRLVVNEVALPRDHVHQLYFSDPKLYPDGVLVLGDRSEIPLPEHIYELGIPVVLVGRISDDYRLSAIGRDEEGIAYQATNYLLSLGHQAIGFIGGELSFQYTHHRLKGYKLALNETLGEFPERWIALGDGSQAAREILANSPEVTAVIFINDAYAEESLPVFRERGKRIPDDLSVISFDYTDFAQMYDPPLTSVVYHRFDEGLQAMKTLVEMMRNPKLKFCQDVLKAKLIKNASCKPVKTG